MLIRLPNAIYRRMKGDLRRPHPHALERVGYVFTKPTADTTLECTDYVSVPDAFYVKDSSVGAHVDHRAIVLAMKRADHENEGVLHVHSHGGFGIPTFSPVDVGSHEVYLRSFRNANSHVTHGVLLLSEDSMVARVWVPHIADPIEVTHYVVTRSGFLDTVLGWLRRVI